MLTTGDLARIRLMIISALGLMPAGLAGAALLHEVGADWFQNAWFAVYQICACWTYVQLRKGKEADHERFE